MDYINIKIGNKTYIQRNEFSKLITLDSHNNKTTYDNISFLPKFEQQLITDAIKLQEAPQKYFNFEHSGIDEITIKKYIGADLENIVIPSKIIGKKVKFAPGVFNNINAKKLILPEGIIELPKEFCGLSATLNEVYLPPSITKIPFGAFATCIELKYINLDNIKEIDNCAFEFCEKLDNINLKNAETIGLNSFMCCTALSNIDLSNTKHIDKNAFNGCKNLKSVALGKKLQIIECGSFGGCGLTKINIPKDVTSIESRAFKNCTSLDFVNFPEKLINIGDEAFMNTKLKGIYLLPPSIKSIKDCAFLNTNIYKVYLSKKTKFEQDSFPLDAILNIKYYEDKSVTKELNELFKKDKGGENR